MIVSLWSPRWPCGPVIYVQWQWVSTQQRLSTWHDMTFVSDFCQVLSNGGGHISFSSQTHHGQAQTLAKLRHRQAQASRMRVYRDWSESAKLLIADRKASYICSRSIKLFTSKASCRSQTQSVAAEDAYTTEYSMLTMNLSQEPKSNPWTLSPELSF